MRNTVFHFGFITFILCCPLFLNAEEARTWQDDTGLFSIEASLEQIDGNSVKLKRIDDGRVITLPINRLSAADQRYIAGLAAQNPFEGGGTPRQPAPRRPSGIDTQQPVLAFPSFADMDVKTFDVFRVREAGGTVPNVWSGVVDPTPPLERPADVTRLAFHHQNLPTNQNRPALQNLPANRNLPTSSIPVMPRRVGFFVDPTGNNAVVVFHIMVDPTGREPSQNFTRIFLGCTATGKTMFHDSPHKLQPHGFSADGKRFAFHQEDWALSATGTKTHLHIAEVTSSGWTAAATFEPFAQMKRTDSRLNFDADIFSATWVDGKHLLVQSGNGTLILLDIDTGGAVWRTRIEGRSDIALSPGKKYCFLPIGNSAVLWEILPGRAVGGVDDARLLKFRFSPNGKRFATCSGQGIILGDVATGAVEAPFFVPGCADGKLVIWLDDRYLLHDDNVIDTASKTVVWKYIGLRNNVKLAGGYTWCFFDRSRQGAYLLPLTIPHAAMMVQDKPVDEEAELALKSGVSVSLVIEDSISDEREEIRKIVEKKITDNGWVLADNAPVSITLSMSAEEKSETAEYGVSRSIGPVPLPRPPIRSPLDGRGIEVEFQPERYQIEIKEDNLELWSANRTTTPPQRLPLDVVRDASLQEVVDKAMEEQNYRKWIEGLFIPRTISRPQKGIGESRVTENGIENISRR